MIKLYIDGSENYTASKKYIELVDFATLNPQVGAIGEVDKLSFLVKKVGSERDWVPSGGETVTLEDDGTDIFGGKIYDITQADIAGVLVLKVTCLSHIEEVKSIRANENYNTLGQTGDDIIADLNTKYLTGYTVTNVDLPGVIPPTYVVDDMSVWEAIQDVAGRLGAIAYIDANKNIYAHPENGVDAPFDLTDTNGNLITGTLKIERKISEVYNEVKVKGAAVTPQTVSDSASITAYGKRTLPAIQNDDLTTNAEALQYAEAELARKKDPPYYGSYQTYTHGLKPGMSQNINSSVHGQNINVEILEVIRRMRTPGVFQYEVKFGTKRPLDLEEILADKLRERKNKPNVSDQDKIHDIKFSATNYQVVAWTAGIVTMADGREFSISSGSVTLGSSDPHWLYFDPGASTVEILASDDRADSFGEGKVTLALATRNPNTGKGARITPHSFGGQMQIDAETNVIFNSIIGDHIVSNAVTANKIFVNELSSLTADIGNVTAGIATIDKVRTAASGARIEMQKSGNWLRAWNSSNNETVRVGGDQGDATYKILYVGTPGNSGEYLVITHSDGSNRAQFNIASDGDSGNVYMDVQGNVTAEGSYFGDGASFTGAVSASSMEINGEKAVSVISGFTVFNQDLVSNSVRIQIGPGGKIQLNRSGERWFVDADGNEVLQGNLTAGQITPRANNSFDVGIVGAYYNDMRASNFVTMSDPRVKKNFTKQKSQKFKEVLERESFLEVFEDLNFSLYQRSDANEESADHWTVGLEDVRNLPDQMIYTPKIDKKKRWAKLRFKEQLTGEPLNPDEALELEGIEENLEAYSVNDMVGILGGAFKEFIEETRDEIQKLNNMIK